MDIKQSEVIVSFKKYYINIQLLIRLTGKSSLEEVLEQCFR